jgi:hypothetical protein
MGFWSTIGGVVSTVATWAKEVGKPIANVVKRVGSWIKDVGEVTEAHLEGKEIILEDNSVPVNTHQINDFGRPDFRDELNTEKKTLLVKIEETKGEIEKIEHKHNANYNKLSLQIEVIELIIASQTFNRFAANIQLHESNLRIHHQTIQNSVGMLDDIGRQRWAIKALMTQVNRVIGSIDKAGLNTTKCERIADIDIDIKPGAVSISKAYEAFEEARELLSREASEYIGLVDTQIKRASQIKSIAENVPEKRNQIENWLDRRVIPMLKKSKKSTEELQKSITAIPRIDTNHQQQLRRITQKENV